MVNFKFGSGKKKKEDGQYIVCYDIENSVIFEVFAETDGGAVRSDETKAIRRKIAERIGQTCTDYIDRDNIKAAQEWIGKLNEHGGKFVLAPMTHKYLSNFYIFNVKSGEITSKFAHSPEEDNAIMWELVQMWMRGNDIYFTAHNLDYEYSFIRYNTTLLPMLCDKCAKKTIIANGTHDIKSIEFEFGKLKTTKKGQWVENGSSFIIRDSYLMTGKSIKKLGDAYKIPKLDYDYEVTRISSEELTEEDYKYNERDNVIALRAILEIVAQNPDYHDVKKIPMSATQHSRNTCKSNPQVNIPLKASEHGGAACLADQHSKLSSLFNMPTPELFQAFFNASGGGLIGVNPEKTNQWHSNVFSFDISSAHPSQAFNKRFPLGKKTVALDPEDFPAVVAELRRKSLMMQKHPREFYNTYLPSYDYLMKVELIGVHERNINGNIINSLGAGKVVDGKRESDTHNRTAMNVNGVTKHGKTRHSDRYVKWFYGTDLIYHLSFYDISDIKIVECYKYPLANCDEYTIRKFEFYGAAKEEYKRLKKLAEKSDFQTVNTEVQASSLCEEYTKNAINAENYAEFLAGELLRIKGIFNGIFGQEYQNPVHFDMEFGENFEITKVREQNYAECIKKTSVMYCTGSYISMWTRFELACMMWEVMNKGGNIFYFATDSIKANGVPCDIFEGWCYGHTSRHYSRNVWNFGKVDCENADNPVYFFTPETLKHIDICKDEQHAKQVSSDRIAVHYTVSGFKANIYLHDFLERTEVQTDASGAVCYEGLEYTPENIEGIQRELSELFKPQIIPPEKTGKLVRDRKFAGLPTDLGQINFGALQAIGYNLGGYNPEWSQITDADTAMGGDFEEVTN